MNFDEDNWLKDASWCQKIGLTIIVIGTAIVFKLGQMLNKTEDDEDE